MNNQDELKQLMACNANTVKKYVDTKLDNLCSLSNEDVKSLADKIKVIKELIDENDASDESLLNRIIELHNRIETIDSELNATKSTHVEIKELLRQQEINHRVEHTELCSVFSNVFNDNAVTGL